MKKLFTAIALLSFYAGSAQNLTKEMLNAYKVEHSILFRLERIGDVKRLTYEIDPRDAVLEVRNTSRSKILSRATIDNGGRLSVASVGTSFNILFDFYNPLKYGYRVVNKEIESPITIAFEKFYADLWNVAKTVNASADGEYSFKSTVSNTITRLYETNEYFIKGLDEASNRTQSGTEIVRLRSSELMDWILWHYRTYYTTAGTPISRTDANAASSISLVDKYIKTEKYIYDRIPSDIAKDLTGSDGKTIFYESYLVDMFEELGKAVTATDFTAIIERINTRLKSLEAYNRSVETLCNEIEQVTFNKNITDVQRLYFIDYTLNKRALYVEKVRSIIKNRSELISNFYDLLEQINHEFIPSIAAKNVTKVYVESVNPGKIDEMEIYLIENNFVVENGVLRKEKDNVYKFDLLVSEYSSIVAEFGLGTIFFSSIEASNYSSSSNTVVKTSNRLFFSPTASLNLIPNIGRGQAFWMMQLGVGSSVERPLICLGTGVRVYNVRESTFRNFSVSVGMMSAFVKTLKTLQEGDPATQDQVDADLHYRPIFKPYIGIQINF